MRDWKCILTLLAAATVCGACTSAPAASGEPTLSNELRAGSKYPVFWPPAKGSKFPDLCLKNTDGRPVHMSSFVGKVVVVEELAMTCAACNAFCGGNKAGASGYPGSEGAQAGMPDFDEYLRQQGIDTNNPNFVKVDIIIYNTKLHAATPQEAKDWCRHFKITPNRNRVVLVGDESLIGPASYAIIPGFQLLDKSFQVVSESSGHSPQDDLWRTLIPKLKALL